MPLSLLLPQYWLVWLGLGLLRLIVLLPYPVILLCGRLFGRLLYILAFPRRRIVETNIRLCFPELSEQERYLLVRENFAATGIALFEAAMAWWWSGDQLKRLLTVDGIEHLQSLDGQGAILLTTHNTPMEIAGILLQYVTHYYATYRPHRNPLLEWVQRRGRECHGGLTMISHKDTRSMVSLLRKGERVWYAPDINMGRKHSVFVPFFGVPTATLTTTSRLAKMGRARVVPVTIARDSSGYRLTFHPAWESFPTADEVADTEHLSRFVESIVRQHPEQYLWAHKRFKTRPQGEPGVY